MRHVIPDVISGGRETRGASTTARLYCDGLTARKISNGKLVRTIQLKK